jgi:hypothetical protein
VRWPLLACVVLVFACGEPIAPLETAEPGVMFTYPIDGQLDVPTGARIAVTFSDPIDATALGPCTGTSGAFCVVGPDGPVDAAVEVSEDGHGVTLVAALAPGTTYQVFVGQALAPFATNLPATGPLLGFTTRSTRPRAGAPTLVAINGAPPDAPEAFRPMLETSTIRLVFSEPLDPRTVALDPGALELVDAEGRTVPATLIASGIHASIDPVDDLVPGAPYQVRVGGALADLGGTAMTPASITLVPRASVGAAPIPQVLRTRQPGDPGPARSRSGAAPNQVEMEKPLIGRELTPILPATLAAELGDPKALGGPIAFTLRRGQRLALGGLDIALGGELRADLSTGTIHIELVTDAGGRLYRNPYQDPAQRPENGRAPLFVDLSMDVAIFAVNADGNAVVAQTVLGVQATGTAIATEGVLAIESVAALDMALLGVTSAPTNLVLELITDPDATVPVDTTAPTLVAAPAPDQPHAVGDAIELVFDEPIDLDRLRAGGLSLEVAGQARPIAIEGHGSTVVIRPLQRLPYSTELTIGLGDVADLAGNPLAAAAPIRIATPRLVATSVPPTVTAIHPGVPCALTGATAASPGRCAGGASADDTYRPFVLPADEAIEVVFSQPLAASSIILGASCGSGSVRVEELDAQGACTAPVPGTLIRRDRGLSFVPDVPWQAGRRYRLALISGSNGSCDAGELCGTNGRPASFDPLNGTESGDAGGPPLVIGFVAAPASSGTFLVAETTPHADVNGSGFLEGAEPPREANRAAVRIVGTTGDVSNARFEMSDCLPATPEVEGCLYLAGAMPVRLGELERDCALPGGATAPACIPIELGSQVMYGTSLAMRASVGIAISTNTGTSVLRIREPAGVPPRGVLIDDGGRPKLVLELALYMDAPDMSIPLSSHDLASKPLAVVLEGPLTFLPDGQIAMSLSNVADVPVEVRINAPLGIGGSVRMVIPAGEMKLQLVSRLLRGVEP